MRPVGLLLLVALGTALAGDDSAKEEAAEAEKLCAAELPRWKLTVGEVVLDNPKEPVLRWTNPSAGRVYGNTYVWLHDGRPAAVGCMFRYFDPWREFNGELAALSGTQVAARRDGKVVWEPKDEWKWQPVPGAPAPAATPAQRVAQLKSLAGEFTVELLDTRNVQRGEDQTPRLLPKPLVRYDDAKGKALDGALFAFVIGTDPELVVLLECDTAAAKPAWRFGVTRMNRDAVRVKHKGEKVWEAAAIRDHSPKDSYVFLKLGLPKQGPKR
jgi:hypothetical protein